jgi:hypothetical protein
VNPGASAASNGCYVALRGVAGSQMRIIPIAFLLVLLVACGEPAPPEAPEPEATVSPRAVEPEPQAEAAARVVAEPEPEPAPAAPPKPESAAPLRPKPEAKPAPVAGTPPPEAPPAALPPPEPAPAPAPALDLDGLEQRLKDTRALGVLTKLALKNEIDDLIDDVGRFHQKHRGELSALRERFELLVMKVTSLLQDKEPELAREVAGAREGLWKLLADPDEFAKLTT